MRRTMHEEEFRILLIENDGELTALLQELLPLALNRRGVRVIAKRHMQEARVALQKRLGDLKALIVDIMLPRTSRELKTLENLERKRRGKLRRLKQWRTRSGPEAEGQVGILRNEIDRLDARIEAVQDLEGGIRVLEEIVKERGEIGIPAVFVTARAHPDLRRRAEALVKPNLFAWIQKPAPATAIVQALARGTEGR
jgi:CheY-like chemotaxis protein